MVVELTGYYDNFCMNCGGSGVVRDFDDDEVPCSACGGRGQWDEDVPHEDGHGKFCPGCLILANIELKAQVAQDVQKIDRLERQIAALRKGTDRWQS